MTPGDSLSLTIEATQRSLQQRLGECMAPRGSVGRVRDANARTDAFLAATSRHLAAVEAVLLPEVRRAGPEGDVEVRTYLQTARRLERTLAMLMGRLYGEAHAVHLAWPQLWVLVQQQLTEHDRLERGLVEAVIRLDGPGLETLARRVYDAETRGPTRPHPNLPHTGRSSLVARRVWAVADRFWDAAQARVVPAPVRPVSHRHDSLIAQYLVADPHFDDHASMREHRSRRLRGGSGPS